jgi:hypothetical protein
LFINQILTNTTLNTHMETTKTKGSWGGARPGGGRPKGSTNRLSAAQILDTAESMLGKSLIQSIMEGYIGAIQSGDTKERIQYEKFLLDKTASTVIESEVTNMGDSIETKQAAFAAALANLTKTTVDSAEEK